MMSNAPSSGFSPGTVTASQDRTLSASVWHQPMRNVKVSQMEISINGLLSCKILFDMAFGHKCAWQYANNYKNPPTPHFLSPLIQINLTRPAVLTLTAVWHHISEGGATEVWLTALRCYSFHPQWLRCPSFSPRSSSCNINNVSLAIQCSVFGCKTGHKSLHFLPTSELLRTLWAPHLWD